MTNTLGRCANCGKRHRLRPAFVGYEDQAICATCEKLSEQDFIPFGDVARQQLREQCQYAVRWLRDPELGKGIRWKGNEANYHDTLIHKDDVETFVTRVQAWRKANHMI